MLIVIPFSRKLYLIILVVLFVLYFFSTDLFMSFLLMEISNLLLVCILSTELKNKMVSIYYFVVSALTAFMLMLFITYEIYYDPFLVKFVEALIYVKLGIFPFMFWNMYVFSHSRWWHIWLISIYSKIILIKFYFSIVELSSSSLYMLIFNMIMCGLIAGNQKSLKKLICCSTTMQTSMLIILYGCSPVYFYYYALIYALVSMLLYYLFSKIRVSESFNFMDLDCCYWLVKLVFLIYISLPPMCTFLIKWIFSFMLVDTFLSVGYMSVYIALFFGNIVMLWAYFTLLLYPFMAPRKNKIVKVWESKFGVSIFIFVLFLTFGFVFMGCVN